MPACRIRHQKQGGSPKNFVVAPHRKSPPLVDWAISRVPLTLLSCGTLCGAANDNSNGKLVRIPVVRPVQDSRGRARAPSSPGPFFTIARAAFSSSRCGALATSHKLPHRPPPRRAIDCGAPIVNTAKAHPHPVWVLHDRSGHPATVTRCPRRQPSGLADQTCRLPGPHQGTRESPPANAFRPRCL